MLNWFSYDNCLSLYRKTVWVKAQTGFCVINFKCYLTKSQTRVYLTYLKYKRAFL